MEKDVKARPASCKYVFGLQTSSILSLILFYQERAVSVTVLAAEGRRVF